MISYYTYKFIHLIGIFLILLTLGGLIVGKAANLSESWKKQLTMINGLALIVVFVAGFGLLARLGLSWPWQGWVFMKFGIWLILGLMLTALKRYPSAVKTFWWLSFVAAALAAFLASYKPF